MPQPRAPRLDSDLAPPLVAAGIMVAAVVPVPVPAGAPGWAGQVAHAAMYAALAGSLLWTWSRRMWPWPAASAFLIAVAYGVLHETLQALLPWRSATLPDVLADAVGAGVVVAAAVVRRRQRRRSREPVS